MTIYALKPRFQALLRPLVTVLYRGGVTANMVTVGAALGSIAAGAFVAWRAPSRTVFLIVPAWLFARDSQMRRHTKFFRVLIWRPAGTRFAWQPTVR